MQLIIVSLTLFFLVLTQEVKAQLKKTNLDNRAQQNPGDTLELQKQNYEDSDWKEIDFNFLSSYYVQDGNNAAVTGGIGDEHLTDFTQKLVFKIPLNQKLQLNLDGGADIYSSASTDNINEVPSSASSRDTRVHGNVGITYKLDEQKSYDARVGVSTEYDYTSVQGGFNFNVLSKDKNSAFNIGVQAFIDRWITFYPVELRGQGDLVPTKNRNSFNGSLGYSRVINKKLQVAFMLEATYMDGLLSTPFHRVFFEGQEQALLEQLPSTRLKIPAAVRLNAYLTDWLIARTYYRFYWDDWGMTAHTASVELPIKINRFLSVYPFYRYHQQSAADYFAPYKVHQTTDEFYTSDYDLSALSSHSYGLGFSYAPAGGIIKLKGPFKKKKPFGLNSIDLKYSHYDRSTGLSADVISLGLGFTF